MGFPGGEGTSNKATLEVVETFPTDRTNPESFVPLLNAPHLFHEMANDGVPIV